MNILFIFRLALLNTFKKRLRVLLAIGGIALTCSVIIILFGLQSGLRSLVNNEIKNGQALDVVTVTRRNVQEIKLDQERVSKIQSISNVSGVTESVGLFGTVVYHGITLNAPVYAVSPTYFTTSPIAATSGTLENEPRGNSIVLSTKALEVFGIDKAQAIGKTISLSAVIPSQYNSNLDTTESTTKTENYTIKAIIDRAELPVFYVDIENMKTYGLNSVAQLNLQLTSPDKSAVVRESVERLGFQTTSVQDTILQINKLFEVIQNILLIFGFVVFAITVSATFTVITLTLMEETRQIGFLRIMGLRHQDVKTLFIVQSIVITFLGALLGCVTGSLAGMLLNGYARALSVESTFSESISVFTIPLQQVILILTLSIVVGWLVGIIPARRAIQINPLEELLQ